MEYAQLGKLKYDYRSEKTRKKRQDDIWIDEAEVAEAVRNLVKEENQTGSDTKCEKGTCLYTLFNRAVIK